MVTHVDGALVLHIFGRCKVCQAVILNALSVSKSQSEICIHKIVL